MTTRRRCETVLLVNEDRDCVDVTGDALRAQGLFVLLAPGIERALAAMRSGFAPDAILLDVTAGGREVSAFVRAVAEETALSAVPVLCVSEGSRAMLQVSPLHLRRELPVPSSATELAELLEALSSEPERVDEDHAGGW